MLNWGLANLSAIQCSSSCEIVRFSVTELQSTFSNEDKIVASGLYRWIRRWMIGTLCVMDTIVWMKEVLANKHESFMPK